MARQVFLRACLCGVGFLLAPRRCCSGWGVDSRRAESDYRCSRLEAWKCYEESWQGARADPGDCPMAWRDTFSAGNTGAAPSAGSTVVQQARHSV